MRIFFLLFSCLAFGQFTLTVEDATSRQPLEQVQLRCGDMPMVFTDARGKASFLKPCNTLQIKAEGYLPKLISVDSSQVVSLEKIKTNQIEAVNLTDNSDPRALAILRKALEHFKENTPANQASYSFTAYNKFSIDFDRDSIKDFQNFIQEHLDTLSVKPGIESPSSDKPSLAFWKKKKWQATSSMFLGERLLHYKYKKSEGQHIDIVDTKVSGLEKPVYQAITRLTNIDRIPSVLKEESWRFYRFYLSDSILYQGRKTYVINFRRAIHEINLENMASKRFLGTVYIDKATYGIAQFIQYSNKSSELNYTATWRYLHGSWFLKDEMVRVKLGSLKSPNPTKHAPKKEFGRYLTLESYFYDFKVPDNELTKKDFKGYSVAMENYGGQVLAAQRPIALTPRQKNAYPVVDSIFKAKHYSTWIHKGASVLGGALRFGILDFPIDKLVDINQYEGFRLGLGLKLNSKFNRYISPDAYAAYGFRDHTWKYGFGVDVHTSQQREAFFRLAYRDDVEAAGRFNTTLWPGMMRWQNSTASMGTYNFYHFKGASLSYEDHWSDNLTFKILLGKQDERALFPYAYKNMKGSFTNTHLNISLKYAVGSKSMMTPDGQYTIDEGRPLFFIHFEKGIAGWGGQFDYSRWDVLAVHGFKTSLGHTGIRLFGGYFSGEAPIWKSFEAGGARSNKTNFFNKFSFNTFLGFPTMPSGRFYNDRFLGFYLRHRIPWSFRGLLGEVSAINAIYKGVIGDFKHPEYHQLLFGPTQRWYQEVGVEWDSFLTSFVNLGFFYRVGFYNTRKFQDNFAVQLRVKLLQF